MASAIDITLPVTGSPTTSSVRANFSTAKTEIEALQLATTGRLYGAEDTVGRAINTADLKQLAIYNSAANGTFTIPTDAVLGLSGAVNASFEIYQRGAGVPAIVAGAGVKLVVWAGYPTSALGVTQTAHRVGANTWAVK